MKEDNQVHTCDKINQNLVYWNSLKDSQRHTQHNIGEFVQLRTMLQLKNTELKKMTTEMPNHLLSHTKDAGLNHFNKMTSLSEEIKSIRNQLKEIEVQSKALARDYH